MKREIKFRGKTIESSIGWIYGDLIQSPGIIPVIQRFEKTIEIKGEKYQHDSCMYVHQLQHALRLCGLYDLADNFKMTKGN